MFYTETYWFSPETAPRCVQELHVAVSKNPGEMPTPGVLDSLGDDHWWYDTGRPDEMTEGNFHDPVIKSEA